MNPSKPTIPNSVIGNISQSTDFFTDVRRILADARRAAYTAVNSAIVAALLADRSPHRGGGTG